jgi:predicted alpha/beta superfamily hydrolase
MNRLITLLLLICWSIELSPAIADKTLMSSPYSLPNTEVLPLASEATGQDYRIYVSLPKNYSKSDLSYPVVFLLDADYSFAIGHNIVEHLSDRGDLPDMILVAIGYNGASQDKTTYRLNRMRDYSPTFNLRGGYGPSINKVSGGGPAFSEFLRTELLPFIANRYRTDSDRSALVGHSMGGMFATYVLLDNPQLFANYIVVSPSLWWDGYHGLTMERSFANNHRDLEARVFFSVGSLEEEPMRPMVSTLKSFANSLENRGYPSLSTHLQIEQAEDHNTIFPQALTHGLLFVFGQP